ncbi:hypothetical protein Tco_0283406 [Tanacetum coccineum]
MPDEYHVECDSMNVAKRPHPDPLNIPFDGDAHNAIEYRSTNEYGSASSSNKTADIGRKKIIIRESTHINGDNVTTQARSCSDGRVYQSRDPYRGQFRTPSTPLCLANMGLLSMTWLLNR